MRKIRTSTTGTNLWLVQMFHNNFNNLICTSKKTGKMQLVQINYLKSWGFLNQGHSYHSAYIPSSGGMNVFIGE